MAQWAGHPSFDLFKLPRSTTSCGRRSAGWRKKRSPRMAADVDEKPRFPEEALSALNASGFNAVHVSRGVRRPGGADSVAACIVIEEVASRRRVCVVDPRGEQARHDGLDSAGFGGS